jgi:hypothetical protein
MKAFPALALKRAARTTGNFEFRQMVDPARMVEQVDPAL